MKPKMSDSTKFTITIINIAIIVIGFVGMGLLSVGIKNADKTGTFSLFGRSFHLNQSTAMSPLIEKNDLIVVEQMPPTSFKQGDVIAYYTEQDEKDFLMVRKLLLIEGTNYILADGAGVETTLSAANTRFLGTVENKSTGLGMAVQFLQSEDGRSMFLWWTVGILLFILGFIILIHVILKNLRQPPAEEAEFPFSVAATSIKPSAEPAKPSPIQMVAAPTSKESAVPASKFTVTPPKAVKIEEEPEPITYLEEEEDDGPLQTTAKETDILDFNQIILDIERARNEK